MTTTPNPNQSLSLFSTEYISKEDERVSKIKKVDSAYINARLGGKIDPMILQSIIVAHNHALDNSKRYVQPVRTTFSTEGCNEGDLPFWERPPHNPKWVQEAPGVWIDHNDDTGDLNVTRQLFGL